MQDTGTGLEKEIKFYKYRFYQAALFIGEIFQYSTELRPDNKFVDKASKKRLEAVYTEALKVKLENKYLI